MFKENSILKQVEVENRSKLLPHPHDNHTYVEYIEYMCIFFIKKGNIRFLLSVACFMHSSLALKLWTFPSEDFTDNTSGYGGQLGDG